MHRHFVSDGIIFDRIGGSGFHIGDGIVFPEADALGVDAKFRCSIQRFQAYRFMILCIFNLPRHIMSRPYWLYPLNYKDDADSGRKRRDQVAFAARRMIESDYLFALRSLHDGNWVGRAPEAYVLKKGLGAAFVVTRSIVGRIVTGLLKGRPARRSLMVRVRAETKSSRSYQMRVMFLESKG